MLGRWSFPFWGPPGATWHSARGVSFRDPGPWPSGVSAGTYSRGHSELVERQNRIKSNAGICYTNIPGYFIYFWLTCVYICFHQRLKIKISCWKKHFCQQIVGVVNGNKTWDLPLRLVIYCGWNHFSKENMWPDTQCMKYSWDYTYLEKPTFWGWNWHPKNPILRMTLDSGMYIRRIWFWGALRWFSDLMGDLDFQKKKPTTLRLWEIHRMHWAGSFLSWA